MAAAQEGRWLLLVLAFALPVALLVANLSLSLGGLLVTILLLVWLGLGLILFSPFLS